VSKLLSTFDSVRYSILPKKIYIRHQVKRSSRKHEKELGMLRFLIRDGASAVDGGAHKGVYSYCLSALCDYVYAFEPNPAMYSYLRKAVPKNVRTYQMALSDFSGTATFNIPRTTGKTHNTRGSLQDVRGGDGAHELEIQVIDLDSMGLENIGFVKLDVEGNELAAIRGATKLIEEDRPVILAELTGVGGNPPGEVVELLESWDYLPIVTIDGRLRYFGKTTSVNIHQNCLFIPREDSRK
jgi:FkbM family methyltransferase